MKTFFNTLFLVIGFAMTVSFEGHAQTKTLIDCDMELTSIPKPETFNLKIQETPSTQFTMNLAYLGFVSKTSKSATKTNIQVKAEVDSAVDAILRTCAADEVCKKNRGCAFHSNGMICLTKASAKEFTTYVRKDSTGQLTALEITLINGEKLIVAQDDFAIGFCINKI